MAMAGGGVCLYRKNSSDLLVGSKLERVGWPVGASVGGPRRSTHKRCADTHKPLASTDCNHCAHSLGPPVHPYSRPPTFLQHLPFLKSTGISGPCPPCSFNI